MCSARARPHLGFEFAWLVDENPAMVRILDRITVNPAQCGGRPCVRGMRIRVSDVLDLFASGLNAEKILEEMPDLEPEDLKACMMYARRRVDHPLLAV
jgi:uncharacterized protein (DUF433 family)